MNVILYLIDLILHLDKFLGEIIQNYGTWTYLLMFFWHIGALATHASVAGSADGNFSSDFTQTGSQTVTFAPGQTTQTVRVAITDNLTVEQTEAFHLNLSVPSGSSVLLGAFSEQVLMSASLAISDENLV